MVVLLRGQEREQQQEDNELHYLDPQVKEAEEHQHLRHKVD